VSPFAWFVFTACIPENKIDATGSDMNTASDLTGPAIISAIKKAGVEFIVSVPDISTSTGLLWPIVRDPGLRLVRTCREGETVGIAAGLSYYDRRALLLFQNTGMLGSINELRAVAVEYKMPICMMVGLLNKEPGIPPADRSQSYGVRIVEPVLDAMGISHHCIETDADTPLITATIERCYEKSEPAALLLGRQVAWPNQTSAAA
jgi:sulfopyruvate decarboxylase subunit alpha